MSYFDALFGVFAQVRHAVWKAHHNIKRSGLLTSSTVHNAAFRPLFGVPRQELKQSLRTTTRSRRNI
jgi:hypothetical protein